MQTSPATVSVPTAETPAVTTAPVPPTDVDVSKYLKMVKMGVPLAAVQLKMQQEVCLSSY